MKKGMMKLTVMTFVLAIIFSTSAMAQGAANDFRKGKGERPSPEERAKRSLEKMTKKLELRDNQVNRIKVLNQGMIARSEAIKNSDLEKEGKKAAIRELRDGYKNNIKALLDEEQVVKFEQWQENRGKKGKGGKKGKKGKGPRGERPE